MCLVRYLQLIIQLANRKDRQASRGSLQSLMRFSDASTSSSTRRSSKTTSLSSNTRSSWSTVESHPLNQKRLRENARSSLPGQQQSLLNPQRDGEARLPTSAPQCSYWCTICKKPRLFTTYGGWTKHEKEAHEETVYICMPDGPVVHKEHGLVCALCGDINPDERHIKEHHVLPCVEKALTARTYNRKYQLENHLESHGVPKGSTVAKGWRRGYRKQAWACGFCVAYFAKSTERFHHIATQHYERGEDLSNWDATNVILGFLQQPKLHDVWEERMKLQFPCRKHDLRWDKTPTGSLISRLELGLRGKEDGTALAMAAFIQSDYYQSRFERLPVSPAALENPRGGHRESRINQGLLQGPERRSSGPYSFEQYGNLAPTTENGVIESGWPQSSSGRFGEIATMESYLGAEAPLGIPALCGPRMRPVLSATSVNLEAPATELLPIQQAEQSSWLGSMTTQANDIARCAFYASETSWLDHVANTTGSTESNPTNFPAESQANFGMSNDYSTPQTTGLVSKFSPQDFGTVHDRPLSPMDLDPDLEATTRVLLNGND